MSKHKSDIKNYAPSLAGKALQYNEVLLKLLALKGTNTSPGLVNEILKLIINGSFKTKIKKINLTTPANRYYVKKKLNSVIDRRLKELQGFSEEPKFVEAIEKTKGKKAYSEWKLTFRSYILALIAFEEIRNDWRGFYQRWRSITPDHWQKTHDLMIKHKITDNIYRVFFINILKNVLRNGELDVIPSDEIVMQANGLLLQSFDDFMSLMVTSKKRPSKNEIQKKNPVMGKIINLNKKDLASLIQLLNDPIFKKETTLQIKDIIHSQQKKTRVMKDMLNQLNP